MWPVIDFADIEAGTVPPELVAKVKERGCAVVRGTFPHEQALQWDRDIVDYVERNKFFENYTGPGRRLLRQRREHARDLPDLLVAAADGGAPEPAHGGGAGLPQQPVDASSRRVRQWFDPHRDSLYPDRIRRRPPGTDSAGSRDPPRHRQSIDLYLTQGYQEVFRHLFSGTSRATTRGTRRTAPRP